MALPIRWTEGFRSGERGAVIIEFAMVAPVLIMLVLGVVQVALLLSQQQGLTAAAREGARTASFPSSTRADIDAAVADAYATTVGSPPTIVVTPDIDQPCLGRQGQSVQVDLSLTATLDIPFAAGRTVALHSAGTFRCE